MIDADKAGVDVSEVIAARDGDGGARDRLVAQCLPLVYGIVCRSLSSSDPADVDDLVQDAMVRVVRGIGGLQEPETFRSWLVAITVNQIREHHRRRDTAATSLEPCPDERADPTAEFVDRALTRPDVAGQRREITLAARWLQPEDRELLALWSLECGGHLTRSEVAGALGRDAHLVAVRISRLRGRLEDMRMLVRAFSAEPRCPQLAELASGRPGKPTSVWHEGFGRHVRGCLCCRRTGIDLLPTERVFMGMVLLPLPIGYTAHLLSSLGSTVRLAATTVHSDHPSHPTGQRGARAPRRRHHVVKSLTAKPVIAAAGVTAVCATVLAVAAFPSRTITAAPVDAHMTLTPTDTNTAAPLVPPTTPTPSTTSPSTAPATPPPATTSTQVAAPTTTAPTTAPAAPSSPAERVLAVINKARTEKGVRPYRMDPALITSATRHNKVMIDGCGLNHDCSGEPDLGGRLGAVGIWNTWSGENVGVGGPVANSTDKIADMAVGLTKGMLAEKPPNDGHRWNILADRYTRVGIGITRDSSGKVWLTQEFSS